MIAVGRLRNKMHTPGDAAHTIRAASRRFLAWQRGAVGKADSDAAGLLAVKWHRTCRECRGERPKGGSQNGGFRVLAVEAARSILQNEHDFPSSQDLQALDAARALLARALEGAGSGQSFAGKETDEAIALATA